MRFAGSRGLVPILFVAVLLETPGAQAAQVAGRVATANGTGVGAAAVTFLTPDSAVVVASSVTDVSGQYQVALPDGPYDIRVAPPVASGFVAQLVRGRALAGNVALDLFLVSASAGRYLGRVAMASGGGVGGVQVILEGFGISATAVTDPSGAFSMVVPPGEYRRRLEYAPTGEPAAGLPRGFSLSVDGTVDVLVETNEMITLPQTLMLSGMVVDPGGTPVGGSSLFALFSEVFAAGFTGTQAFDAIAGADGGFAVPIFPSTVLLLAVPPAGSALGSQVVRLVATDATSLPVVLPDTHYRARVETATGAGVSDVLVELEDANGLTDGGVTGADGVASIAVSPGTYLRRVSNVSFPASNAELPQAFFLLLPGTVDIVDDSDETIRLPGTFRLIGKIVDPGGQPVAGASILSGFFDVLAGDVTGEQSFEATTDANGEFTLEVLPGMGSFEAIPPPGSGLATGSADIVVAADTTASVTLSDTIYAGHVRTAGGAGAGEVSVDLYDGIRVAGAATDPGGSFSIPVRPGVFERHLTYAPDFPVPDLPPSFAISLDETVTVSADVTDEITLPEAFQVTGTVVDPAGQPVGNVAITTSFYDVVATGFSGTQSPRATTDAAGTFAITVFPGSGALLATPPPASGLLPFVLNGVESGTSDAQLGILLQLTGEAITGTVGPGGIVSSDTEGDGATPSDPIETSVITPTGGTVSISESLMTLPAPEGFQFLAQQINIAAPPATPEAPLQIAFVLDVSRVPAEETELTLQVFKNTVPIIECSGAPGTAFPDPCVTLRERLPDGDVRLTVLTSTASPWNLGLALPVGCVADAECDDAISCTTDTCLAGACRHTPQDDACSDGDTCNGAERCDLQADCMPGAPVACPDDGNPCTSDICDPASGSCGMPTPGACDDGDACTAADRCAAGICDGGPRRTCPDDGNPCTADVCDAATGRCGIPVVGSCNDGDPCTLDDRCDAGLCTGDTIDDPVGRATCELQRIATAVCGPDGTDSGLADRLRKRTALALDFLDDAAGPTTPAREARAIEHADRQLVVLLKRINRAKPSRVSGACKAELTALVQRGRATLAEVLAH